MPIRWGALRSNGTISRSQTSANGSGRVRHERRGFWWMVFALVHVKTNLLVGNAGSRHGLTAFLSFDQPILKPRQPRAAGGSSLRRLRRLRLLTTGHNNRQRPANIIVAAHIAVSRGKND